MDDFNAAKFFSIASKLEDNAWLDMLIQSVEKRVVNGAVMPTFPAVGIQEEMHGHANEISLRESFELYKLVKQYAEYGDVSFSPDRTLLDFGCGWGRIARLFMSCITPANIIGVEPHAERVAMARIHNPMLCFLQSKRTPPLMLRDNSIDFVVSFSVFSHLDERISTAWTGEFARILKPGGIAFLTTQARTFVDSCEKARRDIESGKRADTGWISALARSFPDKEVFLAGYDAGIFLHSATNGVPPTLSAGYGETAISPVYIERNWSKNFILLDFVDDPGKLPQAMIVMQRRQ